MPKSLDNKKRIGDNYLFNLNLNEKRVISHHGSRYEVVDAKICNPKVQEPISKCQSSVRERREKSCDTGIFSIKSSRLPAPINVARQKIVPPKGKIHQNHTLNHQRWRDISLHDKRPLTPYERDTASEMTTMYETVSHKPFNEVIDDSDCSSPFVQTLDSFSTFSCNSTYTNSGSQLGNKVNYRRHRYSFTYPAPSKHTGSQLSSSTLTDESNVDCDRRIETEHMSKINTMGTLSRFSLNSKNQIPSMIFQFDKSYLTSSWGHFVSPSYISTPSAADCSNDKTENKKFRLLPDIVPDYVSATTNNLSHSSMLNLSKSTPIASSKRPVDIHLTSPFCYDYSESFEIDDDSDRFSINLRPRLSSPNNLRTSKNTPFASTEVGNRRVSQSAPKASSPRVKNWKNLIDSTPKNTKKTSLKDGMKSHKARLSISIDSNAIDFSNGNYSTPEYPGVQESFYNPSLGSSKSFNSKRESFTTLDQIEMEFTAKMISNNPQILLGNPIKMRSLPLNPNQIVPTSGNICRKLRNSRHSDHDGIRTTQCEIGMLDFISPDKFSQVSLVQPSRNSERSHGLSSSWTCFTELENICASSVTVKKPYGFATQSLNALSFEQISSSSPTAYANSICSLSCSSSSIQLQEDQDYGKLEKINTSCQQGSYKSKRRIISYTKDLESFDTSNSRDLFTLDFLSRSKSAIIAPKPFSPARQLKLKNSVPHLMKALPSLPSQSNSTQKISSTKSGCSEFDISLLVPPEMVNSSVKTVVESNLGERLGSKVSLSSRSLKKKSGFSTNIKSFPRAHNSHQNTSLERSPPKFKLKMKNFHSFSSHQSDSQPLDMDTWGIDSLGICQPTSNAFGQYTSKVSPGFGFKTNYDQVSCKRSAYISKPPANLITRDPVQYLKSKDAFGRQRAAERIFSGTNRKPQPIQSGKAGIIVTTIKPSFNLYSMGIQKLKKPSRTSFQSKNPLFSKPNKVFKAKFRILNTSSHAEKTRILNNNSEFRYQNSDKAQTCGDDIKFRDHNIPVASNIPLSRAIPDTHRKQYRCKPILGLKEQIQKHDLLKKLRDFFRGARHTIATGLKIAQRKHEKKEKAR